MKKEFDPERYSYLFDVARDGVGQTDAEISEEERAEVESILALFRFIDTTWQALPSDLDNIRASFLEKLSAQEPNHPWIVQSSVQTVGDLVQASGDEIPAVPRDIFAKLLRDSTPVDGLLDVTRWAQTIGKVVRAVQMPQTAIGEFLLWANQATTALFPLKGTTQTRYVFTRRQEKSSDRR